MLHWNLGLIFPIQTIYGIFAYIYHTNQPNVGEYTIHGWYGFGCWLLLTVSILSRIIDHTWDPCEGSYCLKNMIGLVNPVYTTKLQTLHGTGVFTHTRFRLPQIYHIHRMAIFCNDQPAGNGHPNMVVFLFSGNFGPQNCRNIQVEGFIS